jgi:hypothetical protein
MAWYMRTAADTNSNDAYLPKTTLEKAGCVGAGAAVPTEPDAVFASVIAPGNEKTPYPVGVPGGGAYLTTPVAVDTVATLGVSNQPAPYTPQVEIDLYGGLWWDSLALADGAVASWKTGDTLLQDAAQGTGASQPTKGPTGVVFDGGDSLARVADTTRFINRTAMPDDATTAAGATPGVGGVFCGLARAPNTTDEFWGLTYGAAGYQGGPGDATRNPSFMRFRYSGGVITKLQEIQLKPLYPTISGCQGVCVDPTDGSLWGAVAEGALAGKAIHVSTAGAVLPSVMQASWPISGIAIVPGSPNKMWFAEEAGTGNNIESRSMVDNSVINTAATTGLSNQDILFYDNTTKCLMLTYGANGAAGNIRVYGLTGTSGALVPVGDIKLPNEWDAVEAIVWEGRKIYGVCDRNYHVSQAAQNAFLEAEICPPMTNVLSFHATIAVPATTSTDCVFEIGTPLAGAGFGVYPTSPTGLNIFANSGASGAAQQGSIVAVGISSMAAFRLVDIYLDTVADTGVLFVDGIQVQTSANMANVVNAITTAAALRIGTASDIRPITGTIKDIIMLCGQSDRQKMEGYRAARWSLTASLPANHPYKNSIPY